MIDGSCDFYVTVVHKCGFVLSSLDYLDCFICAMFHFFDFWTFLYFIQGVDREISASSFAVIGWDRHRFHEAQEAH